MQQEKELISEEQFKPRNMAVINLSREHLLDAIYPGLSEKFKILGVRESWECNTFQILVEHPDLPDTLEGQILPHLYGHINYNEDGRITINVNPSDIIGL